MSDLPAFKSTDEQDALFAPQQVLPDDPALRQLTDSAENREIGTDTVTHEVPMPVAHVPGEPLVTSTMGTPIVDPNTGLVHPT